MTASAWVNPKPESPINPVSNPKAKTMIPINRQQLHFFFVSSAIVSSSFGQQLTVGYLIQLPVS